jgi:hypothetical protein
MLSLLFYLLRNGNELLRSIEDAIPLRAEQKRALFDKFTIVIRATVKGNIVVAIAQGALGLLDSEYSCPALMGRADGFSVVGARRRRGVGVGAGRDFLSHNRC